MDRRNFAAHLPLVCMDANTLTTIAMGIVNAGLSFGLCLGIVIILLRHPHAKEEKKTLKRCHACQRWQEVSQ